MQQKRFLSDLFFLLFVNLLVKPFWVFGIDRSVQNAVGTEGYGTYFALLNLSIVFNMVLDMGLTNSNNRAVAQDHSALPRHFMRMVVLRLILALAYCVLCAMAGWAMHLSMAEMGLLSLLCINQFLQSFTLFLRSNVSGLQLFRTDGLLSVLDRVLLIIVCGIMLWGPMSQPFSIWHFAWAQTGAYALTALVAAFIVMRKGRPFNGFSGFGDLPVLLRSSLPYATLILLMSIYGRMDGVMLKALHTDGDSQAGVYAQAFRLIDAANMMAYLFAVILLPLFAKMLAERTDVGPIARVSLKILAVPAMALVALCTAAAHDVMALLYDEGAAQSAPVLRFLAWSFVPIAAGYVVGTLITASGKLRELNAIAAFSVVASLLLNAIFIPTHGAVGAAITAVVVQSVSIFMQGYVAQLRYGLLGHAKTWLLPLAYILSVPVISYFMGMMIDVPILRMILPLVTAILLAPALFNREEMSQFFELIKDRANR
jgi:O-antigen/teichoic acid export membrane protein